MRIPRYPDDMKSEPTDDTDSEISSSPPSYSTIYLREQAPKKRKTCNQWLRNHTVHLMLLEAIVFITVICLLINSYEKRHVGVNSSVNVEGKVATTSTTKPTEFSSKPEQIEFKRIKSILLRQEKPFPSVIRNFNAASLVNGATVDDFKSSKHINSSWNPYWNSDYALLDREPVKDKAWCTRIDTPNLTIHLAKFIKPIAVSYQHLRWNGTVPDGAPKIYDVVGCLNKYCNVTDLLVSNCEYKSTGKQEQICSIPYNRDLFPINKIRFIFRENHGNVKTTCAYLVKVYGEQSEELIRRPEDHKEKCATLNMLHQSFPFIYDYFAYKNCSVLYTNQCCDVCPQCCTECEINDFNVQDVVGIVFLFFIVSLMILGCGSAYSENRRRGRI